MSEIEYCFDYRFTSEDIKYGFCKIMVKFAKKHDVAAVDYVREDHDHKFLVSDK